MRTSKLYKTHISSDINNVCTTAEEIVEFFKANLDSIDNCCLFELKVILNELIVNAVKHGNGLNPQKYVNIDAGIYNGNYIYLIIEDQGEGYDYNKIKACNNESSDPLSCYLELKENGRGILIVRNLCDNIKFNKKGNKIVIIKKLLQSTDVH